MRSILGAIFFLLIPSVAFPADQSLPPNEMTLAQVLEHVKENNPTLLAARAELAATQELYPQAMAGWKPTISAEASLYKSDIENSNFGSADGTTTKDITFNVEQPLYRSGRTTAQVAEARALISTAEAQYKRIEQSILLSAVQAYMDLIRDRGIYDLLLNNEENLQKENEATKEKLDAGVLTLTDLNQASARLARAQADKINASGQMQISNANFEKLTGIKPIQTLYYPEDVFMAGPEESLLAEAEQDNPDILATVYAHEAAGHNLDATFRNHFPQLYAFATYNRQYDPQPGIVDESEVKTIGLRASIPLYDAGITRSRTRQAESITEQRRFQIDESRRLVQTNIHKQWQNYQSALAEITSRRVEIDAMTKAKEGVKEEAMLGERTVLDILDADQELLESKASLIRARHAEIMARYALSSLLGNLPNP